MPNVVALPSIIPPIDHILSSVTWLSPDEFLCGTARSLAPVWRALLTTDGSTTLFLQALCRTPITLEMIDQQTTPLPPTLTDWLEDQHGRPMQQRRVWLTDGRDRLALGYTLIAPEHLNPTFQARLAAGALPIGLLADELGLPSLRDRLQVGRYTDPSLARQFGTADGTFWCRRYRLQIPDTMTAAIAEIFSPSLDAQPAP
jgi:chorismate-pyruvate lyase